MRTFSSLRTASKPSIRTSSSSSTTSLSGRWPPGRTLVESWSCGRGPCDGLGLIVSREDAGPGSRMPGLGAGTAGLAGSGLGFGSGKGRRSAAESGLLAGRDVVALAWGAWPRDRDGFFAGLLEELTPELSDPSHRVRSGSQSYDGRRGGNLGHALRWRVRYAFRVHTDDTVVDASLLDDQRAYRGVPLEAACARDLQPVVGDHVAADQARDRDLVTADVGLHVCVGTDHEVAVAVDLAVEVAEH